MKALLKYSLLLSLILSFSITSCDSDGDDPVEELNGIKIATTRSSGESEGIGIACNFGQLIKEQLKDVDLDEIKEEIEDELGEEESKEFDTEKFDELLEEIFGGFNKTMYVIVAGENLDFESKEGVEVGGETFSLTWFSDSDEPLPGTYKAGAVKINIENPDDLENGSEISQGKIEVVLGEITDEAMIGTFSGTVKNKDGIEENIEGEFNVERTACEK